MKLTCRVLTCRVNFDPKHCWSCLQSFACVHLGNWSGFWHFLLCRQISCVSGNEYFCSSGFKALKVITYYKKASRERYPQSNTIQYNPQIAVHLARAATIFHPEIIMHWLMHLTESYRNFPTISTWLILAKQGHCLEGQLYGSLTWSSHLILTTLDMFAGLEVLVGQSPQPPTSKDFA